MDNLDEMSWEQRFRAAVEALLVMEARAERAEHARTLGFELIARKRKEASGAFVREARSSPANKGLR